MPHYHFDIRDGDSVDLDNDGYEFADIHAARVEATRTLVQIGKDVLPSVAERLIVVEIRDDERRPLLAVRLTFEIALLRDT